MRKACNNLVTVRCNVLLSPMPSSSINDDVIIMGVNYDKIELSCSELKTLNIPKEFKQTIRTDSQLRKIFKYIRTKNKEKRTMSTISAYREIYEAPDGIKIKKELVDENGWGSDQVKVEFDGSIHSGVTIRHFLEDIFPDDWQRFRLHYFEVALDFDVDVKPFVEQGLYRSWARTREDYKGTKYLGARRSKRRTTSYDKKEERLAKGQDPGRHEYRLEERNYIPPKDRPLVEDWLSGQWRPKAFAHTFIGDTSVRWDGLNDDEWKSVKRHGVQATILSEKRTAASKTKLRKLVRENQWFPLQTSVDEGLYAWTLKYRLEYGISVKYSGKHAKAHQSRQAKQGLRSGALHDGRRENSSNRAHYRFDNR